MCLSRTRGGRIVLVDDEREYWRRQAGTLLAGPRPVEHPVLTRHLEQMRQALHEHGLPAVETLPAELPAGAAELGAELAALAADGDAQRAAALEDRLRAGAPAAGARPGAWVAGVGRAAALGLARAVADGREFLAVEHLGDPRLHALGRRARSVLVVADRVSGRDAVALQQALDAEAVHEILPGVRACPAGYLHGRDLEMMTFVDAKQRIACDRPPVRDLIVDCTLSGTPRATAEDLVVLRYQDVGRDAVSRHGRLRLLAITAHGMSDLIHLNGDYVCGRSRYLEASGRVAGRLPSCMEEGGTCFFKPAGEPLHAHQIQADHVFVNSCGSLRFEDGDFDPLFNVWYAALEGRARSYVGSVRWKDGHGLEGLLYRHLLAAGHPLGEAVALLNRALRSNELEATGDVYHLLGDPEERLAAGAGAAEAVGELPPGASRVRVHGGWGHLVARSPELVSALADGQLLVTVHGRAPFFASAVPAGASAFHLFLFGFEPITGEVPVEAGSFRRDWERVCDAQRAVVENLSPALGVHRLYPDRVRQGGRKNLEQRLLNVSRLARARFADPAAAARLRTSCRRLFEELDRVDLEIAEWLATTIRDTSYRFSEHYQDSFVLADDAPGGTCYVCGGDLTDRRLRHVLRPDLQRVESMCRRCGGITDVPDRSLTLEIRMAELHAQGEVVEGAVELVAGSGEARTGYCAVAVRRSGKLPIVGRRTLQRIRLEARQAVRVDFELELGAGLPAHQYDLQAAVVSATRIYLVRRHFWVRRAGSPELAVSDWED